MAVKRNLPERYTIQSGHTSASAKRAGAASKPDAVVDAIERVIN